MSSSRYYIFFCFAVIFIMSVVVPVTAYNISIEVYDGTTGYIVPDASIELYFIRALVDTCTITQNNGYKCIFRNVLTGEYTYVVYQKNYLPKNGTVSLVDSDVRKVIPLTPSAVQYSSQKKNGSFTDDIGAWMVAKGLEMFIYSFTDNMIMGSGLVYAADVIDRSQITQLAFTAITYEEDPYKYDFVRHWQNIMAVFYVTAIICFVVFGGGVSILSQQMGGREHRTLNYLFGGYRYVNFQEFSRRLMLTIAFGFFTTFGIWMILYIDRITGEILASEAVRIVPYSPENFVTYFVMGIGYVVIAIVMAIRQLLIFVFVICGLGISALYLIPATENLAKRIFFRMVTIVFLQPILILIAAVGLSLLDVIPGAKYIWFYQIGLILLLAWVAIKVMFGDEFTNALTNTASKVVMLI